MEGNAASPSQSSTGSSTPREEIHPFLLNFPPLPPLPSPLTQPPPPPPLTQPPPPPQTYNNSPTIMYPCPFCHRAFRSPQALGGHQNRHRRERDDARVHRRLEFVVTEKANNVFVRSLSQPPPIFQPPSGGDCPNYGGGQFILPAVQPAPANLQVPRFQPGISYGPPPRHGPYYGADLVGGGFNLPPNYNGGPYGLYQYQPAPSFNLLYPSLNNNPSFEVPPSIQRRMTAAPPPPLRGEMRMRPSSRTAESSTN